MNGIMAYLLRSQARDLVGLYAYGAEPMRLYAARMDPHAARQDGGLRRGLSHPAPVKPIVPSTAKRRLLNETSTSWSRAGLLQKEAPRYAYDQTCKVSLACSAHGDGVQLRGLQDARLGA
jgi:hypothetical protein